MHLYHYASWPIPLKPKSRYPITKFSLLVDAIKNSSLQTTAVIHEASRAQYSEVARVHTRRYIAAVESQGLSYHEQREMGFPNSKELGERGYRIAGATVSATERALVDGISGVLGGGAHHAYPDGGRGFCIFNDIAIGAYHVLAKNRKQVLIFDCDVHQGDGTAKIFEHESRVATVSIHSESNYPFRKTQSDLDIGLVDGISDEEYVATVSESLKKSVALFEPDFVFYIAGADPYRQDKLGRLSISQECLAERDRIVLDSLWSRKIPVCILLAGGYCEPIDKTVELNLQTYQVAQNVIEKSPKPHTYYGENNSGFLA